MAGSILEEENEWSADISYEGLNWIISPPCMMSFWFPTFCVVRTGVGDSR